MSQEALLERLDRWLSHLEKAHRPLAAPDWDLAASYLYRQGREGRRFEPVHPPRVDLDHLLEVDEQKASIAQNTRQFVQGRSANNVLLTGARGTGKSSLVKACAARWAEQGLKLIEVEQSDLGDLPDICKLLAGHPARFILFCDDLSFEEGEASYKGLKSLLDGSVAEAPDNVLVYATSNRRHLMPERMTDNLGHHSAASGEIHPGEAVEEKISLSERFGLWISFYPFSQEEYWRIVEQWLLVLGVAADKLPQARPEALMWALHRGSRSGRVAHQFAKDWAGRLA